MNEITASCDFYDIPCFMPHILEGLKKAAISFLDLLLGGLASFFESISAPEFLTNIDSYSIPPEVSWAASAFQLDVGAGIIVSAYIARFILRRIPFIG